MSGARALHWLGTHALLCLEERFCGALDTWADSWLCQRSTTWNVQTTALDALPVSADYTELAGATGRIWMRRSSAQNVQLAQAIFGEALASTPDGLDAWCHSLVEDARQALDEGLARSLIGQIQATAQRQPEVALQRVGSGAVHFACELLGIEFIADSGVLRHVSPQPTPRTRTALPLKPLAHAAESTPLELSVSLGHTELDLAHLLALQPGDVLRLPTQLGDRLPVLVEGQAWALGSLGARGKHKAIQLVTL